MSDYGARFADKKIRNVDRRLQAVYRQAEKELKERLADFVQKSAAQNKYKLKQLQAGLITEEEYQSWLKGQIFQKERWERKIKQVQKVMHDHNITAAKIIHENKLDVYTENYLRNAFNMQGISGVSFELYNEQAVSSLIRDRDQILPEWKIDEKKDYQWNYHKVNNAVTQGIIQGQSVEQIMKRLAIDLCLQNESKMRMFARTAINEAENRGRQQQMNDAAKMGIVQLKQWIATLDGRTRDAHRHLDGDEVPYDKPFKSDLGDIMFPSDPSAHPANVYNCRCRMITIYPKYRKQQDNWRENETIDGKTYQEWKHEHDVKKQTPPAPAAKPTTPPKPKSPQIAGVDRGSPMTHAQADTGRVNPNFKKGGGYGINCQSCVVTYEARLRGYDVEVVPNDKRYPMCSKLSKNTTLAWKNKDGSQADFMMGGNVWRSSFIWRGNKPTARRFEQKLQTSLEDNARYTLEFKWKGIKSGHIVTLHKEGADLVIYDPQSNHTYKGKQVSSYLDNIAYSMQRKGVTYYKYPGVMRVDDKELDYGVANQIMRKRAGT